MRAYCDDRTAALALAASLQRENELLRAENEHLRELVEPGASRWRDAFAHVSSAVTVTVILLGAMLGAGLIVRETASQAEANVTRDGALSARLAVASPHEVAPAPVVALARPSARLPARVIVPASPVRGRTHAHHHHHHHHRG